TSKAALTPAGIWVTGAGTGVQLLNNLVHNITTTSEKNGNTFGIAVYGTSSTPITNLTISGNQVYDLKTGESESVNVDGNVTYFSITNNIVHDNDNIGIDAIGFEGVGPTGSDQARYGEISGNTVYNISGIHNPGEGDSYDADGLYCDGCEYVIFERNTVYACDLNMEAASEHKGHDSRYVTIRNNVFYDAKPGRRVPDPVPLRRCLGQHFRKQYCLRRHPERLDLQLRQGHDDLSRAASDAELESLLFDQGLRGRHFDRLGRQVELQDVRRLSIGQRRRRKFNGRQSPVR
ncbi:MAG: right-handed parallel beta-helix repeat-containing protein, partial [Candidatus Sulfotelmatobacter sp.]